MASEADPAYVFVATNGAHSFVSTDAGQTWKVSVTETQALEVAMHPKNKNNILAATKTARCYDPKVCFFLPFFFFLFFCFFFVIFVFACYVFRLELRVCLTTIPRNPPNTQATGTCTKKLWRSTNFGQSWDLLVDRVVQFHWLAKAGEEKCVG